MLYYSPVLSMPEAGGRLGWRQSRRGGEQVLGMFGRTFAERRPHVRADMDTDM